MDEANGRNFFRDAREKLEKREDLAHRDFHVIAKVYKGLLTSSGDDILTIAEYLFLEGMGLQGLYYFIVEKTVSSKTDYDQFLKSVSELFKRYYIVPVSFSIYFDNSNIPEEEAEELKVLKKLVAVYNGYVDFKRGIIRLEPTYIFDYLNFFGIPERYKMSQADYVFLLEPEGEKYYEAMGLEQRNVTKWFTAGINAILDRTNIVLVLPDNTEIKEIIF
jgi:hypothetical protein